ncbi:helix-turn-helix domain-containing protein [Pseudarthrobacter sp. P1]|uniref:helix-turn-helix domain-containing protein n=1 Tax=Pseudarthrobacter sp. P1 TaxID=3418418 RepID=UPI003CE997A6
MVPEQNFANVSFLTVSEVASVMRVSKMTVYRLVHSGQLPAVRFGKSYRVPESAVAAYLAQAVVDGPAQHGATDGSAGSAHTA